MTVMTVPELRAVPWGAVLAGTGIGIAALAVDDWWVPGGPGSALLWFGLAGFGAGVAFVLDEPAAAVVAAAPRRRRAWTLRVLVALVPILGWLAGTAVVSRAAPQLSWRAMALTGTGFLIAALAVAAHLRRAGYDAPGELVSAASGGAVVLALAGGAVLDRGPALEAYDAWSRTTGTWGALAVVAVGLIVWSGADPMSSRRRSG